MDVYTDISKINTCECTYYNFFNKILIQYIPQGQKMQNFVQMSQLPKYWNFVEGQL